VPTAARDDDPVPAFAGASLPAALPADADEDGADTTPLPVFLPGATTVPRPEHLDTPRGPFEPAHVEPLAGVAAPAVAEPAEPAEKLTRAAAQKLDEIKDLLITAEAIGEANLDRHFDRVSQRQRELIREFFEKAIPDGEPEA
jgi:hypothetical protein